MLTSRVQAHVRPVFLQRALGDGRGFARQVGLQGNGQNISLDEWHRSNKQQYSEAPRSNPPHLVHLATAMHQEQIA